MILKKEWTVLITTRQLMMALMTACCVAGTMPAGHAATEPVKGDRTAAEAESRSYTSLCSRPPIWC